MEVKVAARCFQCGQWFHPRDLEDESYRIGDTEKLVEVWVCRSCLDEWYEEYDSTTTMRPSILNLGVRTAAWCASPTR